MGYLDNTGVARLWQKIKATFVSDNNYVHTDNNYTTADKTKLDGIAAGAEVNVQSDWTVTDAASDAYIKNKPSVTLTTDSRIMHLLGNITKGASKTLTIPSSFRGLILFQGTAIANHALWSVVTSSSGTVTVNEFHSANLTYTQSANTLVITNNTGATSYCSYIGNQEIT